MRSDAGLLGAGRVARPSGDGRTSDERYRLRATGGLPATRTASCVGRSRWLATPRSASAVRRISTSKPATHSTAGCWRRAARSAGRAGLHPRLRQQRAGRRRRHTRPGNRERCRARSVNRTLEGGAAQVRGESGASFASTARRLCRAGFWGLEWAVGIPGTLGGAVVYNAGAYGGCLADVLTAIEVLEPDGSTRCLGAAELQLEYRGSLFHPRPAARPRRSCSLEFAPAARRDTGAILVAHR